MKRWIISDTHFYHDNIVQYTGRPINHTEIMIDRWVQRVKREDVTYHLGDVHFGTEQQLKDIMAVIPGRKYLIRGNHDKWTDTKYMICGFDGVFDEITIDNTLMTHEPTFICGGVHKVNLHGHLHNLGWDGVKAFGGTYTQFNDGKHVCYSPEKENYYPVQIQTMVARAKKKT